MEQHYQLIVIGAGPGGYVAAIEAAHEGKTVAVIEEDSAGGTCLNRGCIPTKTYLHTAELYNQMKHSQTFGINNTDVSLDFDAIRTRKEEVVSQLVSGVEGLFKSNKIEYIKGRAFVEEERKVRVGDVVLTCDHLIVATGSKPACPPIPGLDLPDVVTSDELIEFKNKPYQKLVIIGGGVIGVEFASIYQSFGCDVTIIEAMERILPFADREISQNLAMIMKKRGVKIFTNARVEKIEEGLQCVFKTGDRVESVSADGILVAIGRTPNTQNLFSDALAEKLEMDRGYIPVSETFETKVSGIYAIGDCVKGGIQLAHVASAQGINAVCAIVNKKPKMNMFVVPSCIYTSPEIAYCGVLPDSSKASGQTIGKYIVSTSGKSVIEAQDRSFVKLVFDDATQEIIGAHLMCARATDIIGVLSTAIVNRLTAEQLLSVIQPHPTFVESIQEAVQDAYGVGIHSMSRR